jgi:hypothetical protein
MTVRTKSTVKMICARSGIANLELQKEAQKLLELYEDPNVSPEQKVIVKKELDQAIEKLEAQVTTRRMRQASGADGLNAV